MIVSNFPIQEAIIQVVYLKMGGLKFNYPFAVLVAKGE
jgi:hypothetical protein